METYYIIGRATTVCLPGARCDLTQSNHYKYTLKEARDAVKERVQREPGSRWVIYEAVEFAEIKQPVTFTKIRTKSTRARKN